MFLPRLLGTSRPLLERESRQRSHARPASSPPRLHYGETGRGDHRRKLLPNFVPGLLVIQNILFTLTKNKVKTSKL
jgi:hypothetical protein